ncbi:hypothetical protein CBM2629_A60031 [Cupriavidus taiwanensis]|nr:hypothetical protein CBM2629_A60031 [Cupriavidus taiwanensis]
MNDPRGGRSTGRCRQLAGQLSPERIPCVVLGIVRRQFVSRSMHRSQAISPPQRSGTFCCSSHTAFRKVLPLLKIVPNSPCSRIGLAKRFSNAREPFKQALQFFASFDELPTEIPTAAKPKDSCSTKNDMLKSTFKQSPLPMFQTG